ncbi:MAG TPA: ribonuclease E/G [Clostridiaceae bacterium]
MKKIFIEKHDFMRRIAIKEDDKLIDCFIEEEDSEPKVGQIYNGIVKSIVPAIKCAFIDIGDDRNCYMYLDKKFNNTEIKKGQYLIVEVLKERVGSKEAKVTNAFSIPGRLIAIETYHKRIEISKKIEDKAFISNAKKQVLKPEDVGIILRTNSKNASFEEINEEVDKLYKIYKDIIRKSGYLLKPGLLYGDLGIIDKVLRDFVDNSYDKIVTDDEEDFKYILNFLKEYNYEIPLELYIEERSIFEFYDIEKEIKNLISDKIYLNCGGYIVIDKTEAMHVIDVNSGKNISSKSIEKTVFETNKEAADEIGRQIRLRGISGIIVVDFIDMSNPEYKALILSILRDNFKDDKCKTVVYEFSELNLVQIARRRRGKSIDEYLEEDCYLCSGRGKVYKFSYMKALIKDEVNKLGTTTSNRELYIEVNNRYKNKVEDSMGDFVKDINALNYTVYINFKEDMKDIRVKFLTQNKEIETLGKFKVYG